MELRQLRYLVALADEQHFTRAAAREHVAQPALSQQIRRLEQELGLELVRRTTRTVRLTEAGDLLVGRARRVLAELEAAEAELADLAGLRSGRVAIGAMQSLGPYDLSRVLGDFHLAHPAIDLSVREEVSDPLLGMLAADVVDCAFLSLADDVDRARLEARTLLVEPLVALLPEDHRLARRRRLRLAELRDERFVMFREGAGLRRILLAAGEAVGFHPQIAFETNNMLRCRALTSRGLGVTVVPRSDGIDTGPPVAVVPIVEPALERDVTLVWRRDRHHPPAVRAFLDLALAASPVAAVAD